MADFIKEKLKNGATLLFEQRKLPIVTIMASAKVGAAYEIESEKGIAHFTEHMLFQGTEKRSQKEISRTIEKQGGTMNGFTSEQITSFYCKMPSSKATIGAEVIFDMFSNPKFAIKELEKERGVILAEIDRAHDLPQHFLFDKIKELLYKKPFSLPALGSKENIKGFSRQNFLKWHNNYGAENLIITVVGKTDIDEIKKMTERIFIQKKNPLLDINPALTNMNKEFAEKRKNLDQSHIALAFQAPKLSDKRKYAGEVFNAIFGQGFSSWLHQDIREKRGWAYTIASLIESEKDYGHCIVYAGIQRKNVKKVKELILKELSKFKELKKEELEETKEQCIGHWQLDLEDSEKTATTLTFQEIADRAENVYNYPEKISEVSLEDVKNIAKIKNYVSAVLLSDS